MSHPFHEAFASIHATEQLKQNTLDFLQARRSGNRSDRRPSRVYATLCCTLLAVVLCGIGGYHLYLSPVSYISVDVNPSVELGLNRLDRVVTVAAYNEDGASVLQDLNLTHKPYTQAIELLLANDTFAGYLTQDARLSFTVVSDKEAELLTGIQQCHGYAQAQAECHSGQAQLVEDAHHNGLSFGKYQAILELAQYDPSITPEEYRDLSMAEIRDRLCQYQDCGDMGGNGGRGGGHHGGHGHRSP